MLSGRLKLTMLHEDGREAVIRYIGPGGLAAATAVLRENQYPVTAKALSQAAVTGWDKNTMLGIMHQYPRVSVNMVSIVLERLEEMQQRFLEITAEQTERMIGMVMKAGDTAVNTMALLDAANTGAYGNPEITEINIGVKNNPAS